MIDALVKFGVKDQNVVLSTMAKIKKGQKELAKKTNLSFDAVKGKQSGGATALATREKQAAEKQIQAEKKETSATERFTKAASMAGNALKDVARSAATLDPVAFIQGALGAAGKMAGAIPWAGAVAAGGLDLLGVSVGAAAGAVGSAKQSSASALEIRKRNQQNNLYGGNLAFGSGEAAAKAAVEKANVKALATARGQDAKANVVGGVKRFASGNYADGGAFKSNIEDTLKNKLVEQALKGDSTDKSTGWTPADKTALIQSVSGSVGIIGKPLAAEINKLIGANKNVEQLTQVASGNWSALGTDEGAILQQISNSFAGALPSVKQELNAALLKDFGGKLEKEDPETVKARSASARWARQEERHDLRVADLARGMGDSLYKLDQSLKEVQVKLIGGANQLAAAINRAVDIATPR